MTDAEFEAWDDETVRANVRQWREDGLSEAEIERQFSHLAPNIIAAYRRMPDALSDADDGDSAL